MSKKYTLEDCHALARELGFILLSTQYKNNKILLKWACANGHTFNRNLDSMRRECHACCLCTHRAKKTIEDCQNAAKEKGFTLVSTEYTNNNTKLLWQCENNHIWETSLRGFLSGSCPMCTGCARKTTSDVVDLAKQNGFLFLSPKYMKPHDLYEWSCYEGHTWKASYANIQQGYGCPHCARIRSKNTIQDCHKLAVSKGYECLSEVYTDSNTKMLWRCQKGHEWLSAYDSIHRGKGCPECARGKTERALRAILEEKFNKPFPATWFRHPDGRRFELDCYCKDLKLAVEYDGEQHFIPIKGWGGEAKLKETQDRDNRKTLRCAEIGIALIRVSYLSKDNLEEEANKIRRIYGDSTSND